MAETPLVAFLEMISAFALPLGASSSLHKDADALGLSLAEFLDAIAKDWKDQGFYGTGHLPPEWANKRSIYRLQVTGPGWWVDVEHPDSIAAIRNALGPILHAETGLDHLDTGILRGGSRDVTTRIASWVRASTLDDGSLPLGLRYGSKHGGGCSWAYWLRRRDDGFGDDRMVADMGNEITPSTKGYREAMGLLNLDA
ncbi:hypothetical protein [Arthrobacter sp. A2-55]|uniref:hypothetical protein n=1 Tax=Arthrobacter sp. A2-55 TaxID=2897337 RepID=UPI0021CDE673|nr:hypothetical protein [Arthrobacter sp. A2-55]MCU6480183.1 hypothetical protein [Arthrobacter sp. A2-55]